MNPKSLATAGGAVNIGEHIFNSVFMIGEQYLSTIPTRLLHVYQPITYGIIYIIFSLILWGVNGKELYAVVLDWNSPGITLAVVCGIIFYYLVAQLVLYSISRKKRKCVTT